MSTDNNIVDSLNAVRTDLIKQIEELQKDVEALDRVLNRHAGKGFTLISALPPHVNGTGKVQQKSKFYRESYSDCTTWPQKIYFIVDELGDSDVNDVTKRLMELQPELDEETAKKSASLYLSNLYTTGEIKADTTSKPYVYSV